MALTTRVWSAGKLLVLVGALFLTYVVSAAIGMRVALKTREVQVPALAGKTVNEATALLTETGSESEGGRRPAPRSQGAGRADRDRRTPPPASDAPRAQREGVGQRRAALDRRFRRSAVSPSGPRSCACSRKVWRWARGRRFGRPTTPPARSWRSSPRPRAARRAGGAAGQPRRARRPVRDARSDWRRRQPRRRDSARPADSARRWSATIPTRAWLPASSCVRARRPASRSRRVSPFPSR